MVMKSHGRKYNNQREPRHPTMGSSENHLFSKVPAFSRGKPPPQKPKIPRANLGTWMSWPIPGRLWRDQNFMPCFYSFPFIELLRTSLQKLELSPSKSTSLNKIYTQITKHNNATVYVFCCYHLDPTLINIQYRVWINLWKFCSPSIFLENQTNTGRTARNAVFFTLMAAPGIVTMGPVIPWGEMGCGNDGDLAELGGRKWHGFFPSKSYPPTYRDPM